MEAAQVVALAGFVVAAALVAVGAQRAGLLLHRTRVAEGFRGQVGDLARRVERSLGDVSILIDGVRRHETEPGSIVTNLEAAREAVVRYADEVRALAGPPNVDGHRQAIVAELGRAGRAMELVEYGLGLHAAAFRRERRPEADTAIKRGYLNLIHARESIAEHAAAAAREAEDASPVRRWGRR